MDHPSIHYSLCCKNILHLNGQYLSGFPHFQVLAASSSHHCHHHVPPLLILLLLTIIIIFTSQVTSLSDKHTSLSTLPISSTNFSLNHPKVTFLDTKMNHFSGLSSFGSDSGTQQEGNEAWIFSMDGLKLTLRLRLG